MKYVELRCNGGAIQAPACFNWKWVDMVIATKDYCGVGLLPARSPGEVNMMAGQLVLNAKYFPSFLAGSFLIHR